MEPYWHAVREDQVIGRARRICSHNQLPAEYQNVKVFLYIAVFTNEQINGSDSRELKKYDRSKKNKNMVYTTDQTLYEGAEMKREISDQLIKAIQLSSIDCELYRKDGTPCFRFGKNVSKDDYSYIPNLDEEPSDEIRIKNMPQVSDPETLKEFKPLKINKEYPSGTIKKEQFFLNTTSWKLLNYDEAFKGNYFEVGEIYKDKNGKLQSKFYDRINIEQDKTRIKFK